MSLASYHVGQWGGVMIAHLQIVSTVEAARAEALTAAAGREDRLGSPALKHHLLPAQTGSVRLKIEVWMFSTFGVQRLAACLTTPTKKKIAT